MKEKISALMDGELDADDAASAIAQFRKTDELREQWAVYHLISDVLAQPETIPVDVTQRVNARLGHRSQPCWLPVLPVLAKHKAHRVRRGRIDNGSGCGGMDESCIHRSLRIDYRQIWRDNRPSPTAPLSAIPAVSVSTPPSVPASAPAQINDYLMAHREFSPGAAMHGMAPSYIRTVAESRQNFAR